MSDTQPVAPDTDDLDAFNSLLNGKAPEAVEPTEEVSEVEDVEDPVDEDGSDDETDSLADEDQEEVEEEVKPAPKPKSRLQERIDALVEKARIAEDRERDAIRRIEELEAKGKEPEKKIREAVDLDTPQPDDKLDNGDDKYPLGEFDPTYIRDITRFTIRKETESVREQERQEREANEAEAEREALAKEWDTKLERAREKYEDLDEKNASLENTFRGLDPKFGQYLATTIMSLDYGPEVLRHLADNVAEAKQIVSSGPAKATIALGRLDARFALHDEEKSEQKKLKVSKAPVPPERVNKGTSVSRNITPDTDDLTAFETEFFKKK